MTIYLTSAFSLQMLPEGGYLEVRRIPDSVGAACLTSAESGGLGTPGSPRHVIHSPQWDVAAVGHEGTARMLSHLLHKSIGVYRLAINLKLGDELYVAQPTGRRLAVGEEVDLPELTFFHVTVYQPTPPRQLSSFWDDELETELAKRKSLQPPPLPPGHAEAHIAEFDTLTPEEQMKRLFG